MAKLFLVLASMNGFIAVSLGAFAAHSLKNKLSEDMLAVFNTGVQYHMYHSLALLVVGMLAIPYSDNVGIKWSGYLFFSGIILFSGSLYSLSLSGIRTLGIITPIGGVAFLAAWGLLAYTILKLEL